MPATRKRRAKPRREGAKPLAPYAQPVAGERALVWAPRGGPRALVVGDLHLGIETEFAAAGVTLPSATGAIVRRLEALAQRTRAKQLVIAGDLKHSVAGVTAQEAQEVPAALAAMAHAFGRVAVVQGNHDGEVGQLLPRQAPNVRVEPPGGLLLKGGLLVVHGHAWPDPRLARKARALAMAHAHAAVALEDPMGRVAKEPCWARARVNPEAWRERGGGDSYPEVILMPAFNELCTGVALNLADARPIGPLLRGRCVDLARAQLYLLDGVHLGKVEDNWVRPSQAEYARLTRGISESI